MAHQKNPLPVSILPMTSVDWVSDNVKAIQSAIENLDPSVRLLCLPENSLFLNLGKDPITPEQAFHRDSPAILELQKLARAKNLNLHLGGIPWLIDGKVFNEALLITDRGELQPTYEKLHLFDVNLGADLIVQESRSYQPGQRFNTFEIDGWKFATCICYDLRFPEIFIRYMEEEKVDVFLVPAAFTTKTGELHWKPLLTARAIETQCYVLAPAQVGSHRRDGKLRKSWGQSLVIDPWGRILYEGGDYRQFQDSNLTAHQPITTVLKSEEITSYRQSVPVRDHRRFKVELVKK